MATVYEIVQGLSQAAANAYDGALDENGEPLLAGLKREEGDPILDKRVMDGFNVGFYGNMMCLSYMSEVHLKEVYANGFESDIEKQISEIVKFLQKEYKKITGKSVSLTAEERLMSEWKIHHVYALGLRQRCTIRLVVSPKICK